MTAPIASSVPEEWTDRVQRLGSALSAIGSGGHKLSLGLAGALLHRGVAPNVVPSIVDAATARAGWTAPTPDHYRRNAADTVARWVGELPIRSDVLPELVPVLDEITSTPTEPTVSLEDMQRRLYHAINDAGDGLSVVRVPCGAGKALALDTPIPTPFGWSTMGGLRVGDEVLDEQGAPCTVTFATEVMHGRVCFDVVFDDDTVITADAEHRWATWTKGERDYENEPKRRREAKASVVTTQDIANTLRTQVSSTRSENNHSIPVAGALVLPAQDLPLPPYMFGCWLGDGDSHAAIITSADPEVIDHIRAEGFFTKWVQPDTRSRAVRYGLSRTEPKRDDNGRELHVDIRTSLTLTLKSMGVWHRKHIPDEYLRGSRDQRIALLQGIVDTDGTVDQGGRCSISVSNNPQLAGDIHELCLTLGLRATMKESDAKLYGKSCGTRIRIGFTPNFKVCRLERKAKHLPNGRRTNRRSRHRYIVDVRPRPSVPVRCITVNSPSHLYLASRSFIPTHNTHTARKIATERHAAGLRTTISVPTNELAEQIAADLRAAGVPTLRLFGPTAPKRPDGRPVCEFHASAVHLANGWQSVRWELCEGRGKDPCPYRQTCTAADGMDGPHDALVVVGNHGLLSQLDRATGVRGLLIVDEPPHVLDDQSITDDDLVEAYEQLGKFELGYRYAPAIALARSWLQQGTLDAFHDLADVDPDVPDLGPLLEQAESEDVASAVADTIPQRARAPQADRLQLITTRSDATRAGRLGRASRVLTVLHRALTDSGVRTVVYETHRSKERQMAVVGVEQQLHAALQRDGRVVVTAADAHLYLQHYEDVVGYRPPLVELGAPDGCQVRRVLLEVRSLGRSKRPSIDLVCRALEEATQGHDRPRVALVTFLAWEPWARGVAEAWAREHGAEVAVGHYMALRGLDHWRDFDALVTLGDPIPNVHHVARTTTDDVFERAKLLARAELEQAHGRLRVVHRTTPCTQLHVGRLMPFGWPAPPQVEVHRPPKGRPPGRPARERVDGDMLQRAVDEIGGVRATARWLSSEGTDTTHTTVRRWLRGECAPPPKVVASLRAAAQRGKRRKRDSK